MTERTIRDQIAQVVQDLYDQMVKDGVEIGVLDVTLTSTYSDWFDDVKATAYNAELLERDDGTWAVQERTKTTDLA